jgi:hypothetical protein
MLVYMKRADWDIESTKQQTYLQSPPYANSAPGYHAYPPSGPTLCRLQMGQGEGRGAQLHTLSL